MGVTSPPSTSQVTGTSEVTTEAESVDDIAVPSVGAVGDVEAAISDREQSLQAASERLLEKKRRMRIREASYRDRVRRLKEREGKIKRLVDRNRLNQPTDDDSDSS